MFFTEELVDRIIIDTNNYAAKKLEGKALSSRSLWKTWYNVKKEEFWAFIVVIVNMGIITLGNIKEYWSTDEMSHIPFFANTFTRDRFVQICWMLHVQIVGAQGNNITRLQRITGCLDYVNSRLLNYFIPSRDICVDEFVVKFKGRISFITYITNYTQFMGGVDLADQYCSTYCFLKKSLKWWRKLFFWGLEICIINSYILYKQVKRQSNERPLIHLQFRKNLVNKLKGDFRQPRERASKSTSNPDEIRLNGKLHVILTGTKKDYKVCSTRSKPGGRHKTTYYCDTCPDKPRMHLGECAL